ncbi:MAG: flagellar basal body P-ring protein FlgI [Isosphaeraceae bacterium]
MRLTGTTPVWTGKALVFAMILVLGLTGASGPKRKKRVEPPPPKVDETISDLAYIQSSAETKLEGVGLVVGLDDTGVDPPPSAYRSKLVDDMRKEGVENANNLLKDPRVAMVIVRVTIPPGATPKDRLDAQVELPPASGTRSLAGGYLLKCRLREVMVLGGMSREGQIGAVAQGPVMVGSQASPGDLKSGRILGGARARKEVPFKLILNENRRSFRTSSLLEGVVNQRFPQTQGVEQKGSAVAKTDQYLELKIPQVYHLNQDRFFRVVKLLPIVDTPPLRVQRMAVWGKELLDPKTAGIAALRLEGLGVSTADTLRAGLASRNPQVAFLSAEALAYLNDPAGANVLSRTATSNKEFRAYALAALAAMDQPVSHLTLRKLMDEPDIEVRYGAFNALRTLSADDPFLGQVRVLDELKSEESDEPTDSMAVSIARASNRRRREDPFSLYVVDSEGPPMVHVARTRRCEVVIFGRSQKLLTPVVLGNGSILLNAADGDDTLQISKIVPTRLSDTDAKVQSTLELGDVIRQAANLGASYPDIVAILQSAERQRNLAGPLVVDALPGTSPLYVEAAILGKDTTLKKDDAIQKASAEVPGKTKRRNFLDRVRVLRRGGR